MLNRLQICGRPKSNSAKMEDTPTFDPWDGDWYGDNWWENEWPTQAASSDGVAH